MNGAGDKSRLTRPPQASQTVNGASVIRWRISNTRWHFSHWYSYVGTL
jgi:hypothetical protein